MNVPMLQPNERKALQVFIHQLQDIYSNQILQTILYGSKARGDSTPDSDIDVLIILNQEDLQTRNQILTIASRVSLDHDVLLNPVIVGEARYKRQQGFTFYQNAVRDAIQLSLQRERLILVPGIPGEFGQVTAH